MPGGRRRGFPAEARPPGRRVAPVPPRPPVSGGDGGTAFFGGVGWWWTGCSGSVPSSVLEELVVLVSLSLLSS